LRAAAPTARVLILLIRCGLTRPLLSALVSGVLFLLCRRAATTLLLISALVLAAALLVVLVHQFSLAARQIILVGKERQGNRVKAMPADSFVAPKTTAGFDTYASETVSLFRREDKFRAYAALSTQAIPRLFVGLVDAAPASRTSKASACQLFRGYHAASTPAAYASRVMLPPPLQRSLPAGLPLPGGSRTQSGAPCDGDHGCRSGLSAPAFRLLWNGR